MIFERIVGSCLKVYKAPTWGGLALHLHKIWVDGIPVVVLTKRDQRAHETRNVKKYVAKTMANRAIVLA